MLSNSLWLRLRAFNDLLLITPLSTVDTPQSVSLSRANSLIRLSDWLLQRVGVFLGPWKKTGRPRVMARDGRKIRFVCVLCILACVLLCGCLFGRLTKVSVLSEPTCISQESGQAPKSLGSTCRCSWLVSLTCPQWRHHPGTLNRWSSTLQCSAEEPLESTSNQTTE